MLFFFKLTHWLYTTEAIAWCMSLQLASAQERWCLPGHVAAGGIIINTAQGCTGAGGSRRRWDWGCRWWSGACNRAWTGARTAWRGRAATSGGLLGRKASQSPEPTLTASSRWVAPWHIWCIDHNAARPCMAVVQGHDPGILEASEAHCATGIGTVCWHCGVLSSWLLLYAAQHISTTASNGWHVRGRTGACREIFRPLLYCCCFAKSMHIHVILQMGANAAIEMHMQ